MAKEACPQCGTTETAWCPGHKVKVKGGWAVGLAQDVCFSCLYEGPPYSTEPIEINGRTVIIMNGRDRPVREVVAKDEKLTFKAVKGDMELTLTCGKDGLNKLLSIFMEV